MFVKIKIMEFPSRNITERMINTDLIRDICYIKKSLVTREAYGIVMAGMHGAEYYNVSVEEMEKVFDAIGARW